MSTVAISGASGFVGAHLCPVLTARGHRVLALSRAQLHSARLGAVLEGAEIMVHLAARAHVLHERSSDPQAEFTASNVRLTQTLASAAQGAGVKRFIFVSSAGVLGVSSPAEGFGEESPPQPHDAYSASKLEAEQCLHSQLSASLGLIVLRPPLIYGAGARGNFARLLRLAIRGWPLPLGALRAQRSMVGVRNLVDLICALSMDLAPVRATMLVADRELNTVAGLFRTVAACAGHQPWLAPVPVPFIRLMLSMAGRGADIVRLTGPFVVRPRIAQQQFNWSPPYSQGEEIQQTVRDELESMRGGSAN